MAQTAPGKHYRKGLSLVELTRMFPDDASAERWFVETRWPDGVTCPYCDTSERVKARKNRKPMPYYCGACRKYFSVRTGTPIEASNLGLQKWAIAFYLLSTNLKGASSMKLHRDIEVTQKTAWHLAHRIRESWGCDGFPFSGPVEVDETFVGGKAKNMHAHKRKQVIKGRGSVGKTAVVGAKDRQTNRVSAAVVKNVDQPTLQGFVAENVEPGAKVYTDDHGGYEGLPNHETVRHSVKEYVNGQAHTNGIESFWAMLKRGYVGTYHRMSAKHLHRYVDEFAGRHNVRTADTIDQMAAMVRGMDGKRPKYDDLIAQCDEKDIRV